MKLHIKEQENIMNVDDAGSSWIEAFPINDRTTLTVMNCLSAVSARFEVTKTLVSSNGPIFGSDDFKTCCKSQGVQKKRINDLPLNNWTSRKQMGKSYQSISLRFSVEY